MLGSLSCKFIRTVERRRPVWGDDRLRVKELLEDLREGSCCSPAFMVAAACREMDAERGEPGGDSSRMRVGPSPFVAMSMLADNKISRVNRK
jgi:hypothetical protein